MKRFIVSLMVVAGALLSACTQEEETLQSVGLAGTYDLTQVGDLLFVTSADNDELRALQLSADATQRRFVRAPNPLEPLSIPVLDLPQALTHDVSYGTDGLEKSGGYVFARSNGSTLISVVGAAPGILKELARLDTKQLTASQTNEADRSQGPVTAFAARTSSTGGSTLYYSTLERSGARLWVVELPAPAQLDAQAAAQLKAAPVEGVALPPNVSVTSLLVMPQPELLAVSTRSGNGAGKSYRVNLQTHALLELSFGSQVLRLATHERVEYTDAENKPQVLEAGARIFGVLDASSCGGQSQCTGVLAVDANTGAVLNDVTKVPMLTINAGAGLPTGLSLSRNTQLQVQQFEPLDLVSTETGRPAQRAATVPLLGIVSLSNGQVLFIDAVNLVPFNVNANNFIDAAGVARTKNEPSGTITYVDAQGATDTNQTVVTFTTPSAFANEPAIPGAYGVTRDQTINIVYEGTLPGMGLVTRASETAPFEVPSTPGPAGEQVVQPGDIIILLPIPNSGQATCTEEMQVASVQPSPTSGLLTLVPSPIPAACASYTRFQIRAGGAKRLVANVSGRYLGRRGPQEEFETTNSYFFHPPGYQGQATGTDVKVFIGRLPTDIARGAGYVIETSSHYFPYVITVDNVNFLEFSNYRLPGSVVHAKEGNSDYAYIAYPSANGVLQVDLMNIDAGVANSRGLFPYQ